MQSHMPSSSPPSPPPNPNPKSTQTLHFLRLLSPLLCSSSSSTSLRRRRRFVHRAAYASMALAVGPRMKWSRSILRRLHRSRPPVRRHPLKSSLPPTTTELRRLVPGGKSMDMSTLLEETGHYIHSLTIQVTIMRSLLDSSSPAKDKNNIP